MSAEKLTELVSQKLDEKALLEILKKYSGLNLVTIDKVIIKDSATTKGDSYLSVVERFTIEGTGKAGQGENKKLSCAVIVKALPKNIGRRKSFRSTDFFRNEVIFYNEVCSSLLKFQDSKNVKNKFDNLPICLSAVADGTNDYIALEDLCVQNYGSFRRQGELDYDSVIMIVRLFARFHALSFAFKDQCPKEFEKIRDVLEETYFAEKFRGWYQGFHKSLIAVSRDAIEKELPPQYLEKFDNLIKNDFYGQLSNICKDTKNPLAVITQGDAWIPNFMVKYSPDGKALDIKMIDFQLARCCTPTTDLSFFLYVCASYSMLSTRWDDIIKDYHTTFTQFLSELGSDPKIFTLEALQADMKKHGKFGIGMAMEALPFQMLDNSETPDLDTIQGDEAVPITTVWKVYPKKTSEERQKISNVFKHAIDMGFIP